MRLGQFVSRQVYLDGLRIAARHGLAAEHGDAIAAWTTPQPLPKIAP